MSMRDAWEAEARNWVAWARDPQDSYWRFHAERFFELLPAARATLDVGCGEGRLPRDLKTRGYSVIGVDGSATLIDHAREADPSGDYRVADAAALPLGDESVALVTALMSLHDTDDMPGAVREAARVLVPGGRYCIAIIHPLNSAGRFETGEPDAAFAIRGSYFEHRRYADTIERGSLRMTFTSEHRPLQDYVGAIVAAGLLVERLVEIPEMADPPTGRWRRVPLYLQLRAVKPG
jgi:SAM-dependent methyltransferase